MEPEPVPVSKELVYLAPCGAILSKALHLCQAGLAVVASADPKLNCNPAKSGAPLAKVGNWTIELHRQVDELFNISIEVHNSSKS